MGPQLHSRRSFLAGTAAGLIAWPSFLEAQRERGTFHVGVIADTHIIDDFYKGPEGSPEDTESIFKTEERLVAARAALNALTPALDLVFLVGDYFHDYPSTDLEFYFTNRTRVDRAKAITDGFRAPVHVGFGNHDYAVPKVSRDITHELFRRKLGLRPYYAVDHRGWKFIHLNNFLGADDSRGGVYGIHAPAHPGNRRRALVVDQFKWRPAEVMAFAYDAAVHRTHERLQQNGGNYAAAIALDSCITLRAHPPDAPRDPEMEAGAANRLWSIDDIVGLLRSADTRIFLG